MRILLIADNLDYHNGWGRYTLGVRDELIRLGHEVRVLTQAELPKPRNGWHLLRNSLATRRLARDYEIVHALDVWPFAIYGYAAVLGTAKKFFINLVGTYSVPPLTPTLKRFLMTRVLVRANWVFAISNYVARIVGERIPNLDTQTIYLGLSPLPEPSREEIAWAKEKIGSSGPVIITVGTVEARKGQEDVVRALVDLKKNYPNILYLVVGVNADEAYLKNLMALAESLDLSGNIRYIPDATSDAMVAALYAEARVFVLVPRRFGDHIEGFGLVVVEAASCGVPAVVAPDSGALEAIEDEYSGLFIRSRLSGDIAHEIETILRSDSKKWHQQAQEFSSRFTWSKTVDQYINKYKL